MSFATCTEVTAACPVSATTYGYTPSASGNGVFLMLFGICAVVQLGMGIAYRTWTFLAALTIGCAMEFIGYIGCIQLHANPWNKGAYRIQITLLILAPSFVAAGIYLSVKHTILYLGPEYSRLTPKYLTLLFISCDALSFLVQGAGGGIAASSGSNLKLLNTGNSLMVGGISSQVVTMSLCGVLALEFVYRYYRHHVSQLVGVPTGMTLHALAGMDTKVRAFCLAIAISYVVVLIRCIYRIPEMTGGWGNPLMRDETEFLMLDGFMMIVAAITLTVFHPGVWLSSMSGRYKKIERQSLQMHRPKHNSIHLARFRLSVLAT